MTPIMTYNTSRYYNPVHKLMEKRQIYRKVAFLMYTEMVNFIPQS